MIICANNLFRQSDW